MRKVKFWLPTLIVFFFPIFFSSVLVSAQDYLLLDDGFENEKNNVWTYRNSRRVESQSYKGNRSVEVNSNGEITSYITLSKGVKEIIVKGRIKLKVSGSTKTVTRDSIVQQDSVELLKEVLIVSKSNIKSAFISIESYANESSGESYILKEDRIGELTIPSEWRSYKEEVKIPKGTTKIKVSCINSLEGFTAYFDEIIIEERQVGFVEEESDWAKAVRENNEKAKLLVKNGDFEEGGTGWNSYWGFGLSDIAHTGKYSCMIHNKDSGTWKGSGNVNPFKIPAGTSRLKISAWVKADNIVGGPNAWETGAMLLTLLDNFGNELPGGDAVLRTVGTHDWRKFESYFTVSDRATNFSLALQMGASTGKIYFDDILAEPMTEEEFYLTNIVLKNPGFENLLSGWPTYAGEATSEEAHTGEYSLKVGGKEAAWEMRMQSISLVKDQKEFTFSIWIKTKGITETPNSWEGARVYLEFKDLNGISLNTEDIGRAIGETDWNKFEKLVKIPEDAVEVTISCGRANVAGNAYFDDAAIDYQTAK